MDNHTNFDAVDWELRPFKSASYAHFDNKIKLRDKRFLPDNIWNYISNKDKVAKHGFYPFIYSEQITTKYSKVNGLKSKVRPICYSAHLDRCIFKYYGHLLNEKYNEYVLEHNIHFNSVAYRDNLYQNNIHFAKKAFDFIQEGECDIFIGDFFSFFDNLDHKYLKRMLCKVLQVKNLSDDWYAVFKNITKYSTFDIVDILKINEMLSDKDLTAIENATNTNIVHHKTSELNNLRNALTKEKFKQNKHCIKPHKLPYGIPQGSSISAVLSNVYMIEFDEKIQKLVSKFDGLYMRYSDDFIIVLPKTDKMSFNTLKTLLGDYINQTTGLEIHPDKRKTYQYRADKTVVSLDSDDKPIASIDYLGFVFDGVDVTIRQKTISKYYTRLYRKLDTIVKCNGETRNHKRVSYRKLYETYTQKGRNGTKSDKPKKDIHAHNKFKDGNFFTYVYKADKIFNADYDPNDPNSHKHPITRCTIRHMLKIRRVRDKIDANNAESLETENAVN